MVDMWGVIAVGFVLDRPRLQLESEATGII